MSAILKSRLSALGLIGVVGLAALLGACDGRPEAKQQGFRGTGMAQIDGSRALDALEAANKVPKADALASDKGPLASADYKNVQVLGDLSTEQFNRLMLAITEWVAPEQGCAYCHNVENMAADTVPTKIVARRMFQMTGHINADWKPHVQATGVTCYTCHRGQPVPKYIWFNGDDGNYDHGYSGMRLPTNDVGISSLPNDPYTPFLEYAKNIRVASTEPMADRDNVNAPSIQSTEQTYGLMIHMSKGLGVNCSYCHNSRAFSNWEQSNPARVTAWYGIRMARDLNTAYLNPLKGTWAANRLGPSGDSPKLNCATCHQGVNKPLYGVSMLKDYPELLKVKLK